MNKQRIWHFFAALFFLGVMVFGVTQAEASPNPLQEAKSGTKSLTGVVTAITFDGFVLSHEVDGKKQEATFSFDLNDAVVARGKESIKWIPPNGKQIVVKLKTTVTVEYLVEGETKIVTTVKEGKPKPDKKTPKPKS
jgi:hypothetical protein